VKNTALLTLLATLIAFLAYGQYNFEWTVQLGGSNTDYAYAIAVDNDGNVITGGEFRFTIDFDPGIDTEALLTSVGTYNAYISKLNASGGFVWARSIEGQSRVLDVHTDDAGNVYASGRFRQTVVFPNGSESIQLTSNGQFDMFLAKYTSSGDLVWAFGLGGIYQDFMTGIAVDANGNLIVCGEFSDTVDFDPGQDVTELEEIGGFNYTDAFVAKYDSDGNFVWARKFSGESLQTAAGVALSSEGDILMAGHFAGSIDCDPGPDELIFENGSELDWQGYIVKLTEDGDLIWGKSFGGVGNEWLFGMTVDEQDNVYATGGFDSAVADFDPGTGVFEMTTNGGLSDAYIVKLNSNGDLAWAKQFEGPEDGGCFAIDVEQGVVYTTGYVSNACDFDPGPDTHLDNILGSDDGFISALNADGEYLWSQRLGGGQDDFGFAILVDPMYIYATGTFKGNSVGFGNTSFNSNGFDDAYVTKIQHPSVVSTVDENQRKIRSAYPNPTTQNLFIEGMAGTTDVMLVDLTGKVLLRESLRNGAALDLSQIAAGIYTVVLQDPSGFETIKIVVAD